MHVNVFPATPPRNIRGTISVVALMVCAAGTFGLLALMSIVQARVGQVEAHQEECLRRVRELNGRQLAKEVAFRRIWTSASGTAETVEIPGGWGRIEVPAWSDGAFSTTDRASFFNHVGPMPAQLPYEEEVAISVYGRVDATDGSWFTDAPTRVVATRIQTYPTLLGGYVLDARRQEAVRVVSGELTVHGRALVWQAPGSDNVFSFRAQELRGSSASLAKDGVEVLAAAGGTPLSPVNLPGLTLPNWFQEAAPGGYPVIYGDDWAPFNGNAVGGSMAAQTAAAGAVTVQGNTTYDQNGIACNGAGTVTVDLNNLNLPSMILNSVTSLVVNGQTFPAQMIALENLVPTRIVVQNSNLVTVQFRHANRRPLIVTMGGGAGASEVPVTFDAGADYRLILLNDRIPLRFASGGRVDLRGGVCTDHDLVVGSGEFHLHPETANPSYFEAMLWRSCWVESYQRP